MRVDLSDDLVDRVDHLVEVAAAATPEAVIAVIVDADGANCPQCTEQYRQLCTALAESLSQNDIELWAAHVVDRVAVGGRWHCVDGCGSGGAVDDPSASPLAAAAVLEGRRLYPRRADLQAVIAPNDPSRSAAVAAAPRNTRPGVRRRIGKTRWRVGAATWRTRWPPQRAPRAGNRCRTQRSRRWAAH